MEPIEALTLEDKETIKNYIENFSSSSKRHRISMRKDVDYVLQTWNKQKQTLFAIFGDQLIIKKTFKLDTHTTETLNKINNYLYDGIEPPQFYAQYCRWANKMEHFITRPDGPSHMAYNNYNSAIELCEPKILASNIVKLPFEYFKRDGKVVKVPAGAKVMKVLSKIAKEFDLKGFEQFRIDISRFTEVRVEDVEITLSIHPMDYMTMSDNANGWESCMNWTKGPGSYRAGTVEMLNSPYVVVAYISTKDYHPADDITWNSKQWRELVIVHPNVISSIKSYPYYNINFDKAIVCWLAELTAKATGIEYNTSPDHMLYNLDSYNTILQKYWPDPANPQVDYPHGIEFSTGFMYNDFGNTENVAILSKEPPKEVDVCVDYSGTWECMCCGSEYWPDDGCEDESAYVVCDDCEPIPCCSDCGSRVDMNYYYFEVDGDIYCEYCYTNLPRDFVDNSEAHHPSNMIRVYAYDDETGYLRSDFPWFYTYDCSDAIDRVKKYFEQPDLVIENKYLQEPPFWGETVMLVHTGNMTEQTMEYWMEAEEGNNVSRYDIQNSPYFSEKLEF